MSTILESLQNQLEEYAQEFSKKVPGEVRQTMNEGGREVADFVASLKTLGKEDQAASFALPDVNGDEVKLEELLQQGPVVLSFYRGGWCPYCNLELRALQAALPEIRELGASLVAISPQTPDQSLSTSEKNELEFSVLSDVGNQVAREFGLVFSLPESLRPIYAQFGIDIPAHNGDDSFDLPVPATYVIDRDGTIKYSFVNVDYQQRGEPSEIVAALRGLQG